MIPSQDGDNFLSSGDYGKCRHCKRRKHIPPQSAVFQILSLVIIVDAVPRFCEKLIPPGWVVCMAVFGEAQRIINQNTSKQGPDGQFAPVGELKIHRMKISNFDAGNPGKDKDHARRRHDIAPMHQGAIREWWRGLRFFSHTAIEIVGRGLVKNCNRLKLC